MKTADCKRNIPNLPTLWNLISVRGVRGILGDEIGDTKHHGGLNRALHCFSSEHYDYFSDLINGEAPPRPWVGENLTLRDRFASIYWRQNTDRFLYNGGIDANHTMYNTWIICEFA